MKRIQAKKHKIGIYEIHKISLSSFDDKRFVLDDGVNTLAYFHKGCNKTCNKNENDNDKDNDNDNENENENENENDNKVVYILRLSAQFIINIIIFL